MIRIAAVADLHFAEDSAGKYRRHLDGIEERADVLLIAGDLTRVGDPAEAKALAGDLAGLPVPAVAVLGNHDYHSDREEDVVGAMENAGVRVLEGSSVVLPVGERRLGIAGIKGFGGGFLGASGSDFGEPEMKAFIATTRAAADALERELGSLEADVRVALIHYAPVPETLAGERLEIYPFLGSYLLAEAIDRAGADLVVHGHAHAGSEQGVTPGGVPVRNVAMQVIASPYHLYCFGDEDDACEGAPIPSRSGATRPFADTDAG